ncbi:MAG: hypothetical protein RL757_3031 [Bacteroidota bacterium]
MKTIIIDDEAPSRDTLLHHLKTNCPTIQVIGVAQTGEDGLRLIKTLKPELVFLDIEIGDMTGFELLQRLEGEVTFECVFCTAHNSYAATAFRFSATDFLQKPIKINELLAAVVKAQSNLHKRDELKKAEQLLMLNEALKQLEMRKMPQKLGIQSASEILFVEVDQIIWIRADRNYTEIALLGGSKPHLSSKQLSYYEELLKDEFIRVHRSHIINPNYVTRILKGDDQVEMQDKTLVPISKGNKERLLKKMSVDT